MQLFPAAVLIVLAWGSLAFGAEYSWAYAPLMVLASVTGVLGFRAAPGVAFPSVAVLLALGAIVVAVGIQAIPVPRLVRETASSRAPVVDYARLHADAVLQPSPGTSPGRTLSIAPERTVLGLGFLLSLAVLFVGSTRAITALGLRACARGIVALGVVVAFVGLVQSSTRGEDVYGLWRPPKPGAPFAPFINANHFAGWMVMAMSLAMGWLAGGIASALRAVTPGWRNRVLWFASQTASKLLLTAFGVAVMAVATAITYSRGGLVGLTTALVISSAWVSRWKLSAGRRLVSLTCVALVVVVAVSRVDVGRTVADFEGSGLNWGGRQGVWRDAWRIIHDYPLAGTGLNTFGIAMLHYQTAPRGEYFVEAHNDYLQLAAEGGLLLGVPILILLGLFVREVWRRFREKADDERTYWLRAGAVTGLCSIAVMEIFDFTLQMPGAAVLFVVLAAIAIHRPDYLKRRSEERPREP